MTMKKMISLALATCMAFALAVSAGATEVAASTDTLPEETYTITMGGSVEYTDENGQLIVDELKPQTKQVSKAELAQGVPMRAVQQKSITNIGYFLNDTVECTLTASFKFEAGNYVRCAGSSYKTRLTDSSLEKVRDYVKVTQGSAEQWCRVTYTSVILKQSNTTKQCNVWIECTRGGAITKS